MGERKASLPNELAAPTDRRVVSIDDAFAPRAREEGKIRWESLGIGETLLGDGEDFDVARGKKRRRASTRNLFLELSKLGVRFLFFET